MTPGLSWLVQAFGRYAIEPRVEPPTRPAPDLVLDMQLDPDLRALYDEHDRVSWWAPPESGIPGLFIFALESKDVSVRSMNSSMRQMTHEFRSPYPFERMLVFAQYDHQATYLATVPELADDAGRQPVMWLNVHEDPYALPIASSVDGAFSVLASYATRAGAFGPAVDRPTFPLETPDLIGDARLRGLYQSGALNDWLGAGDSSISEWLRSTLGERV